MANGKNVLALIVLTLVLVSCNKTTDSATNFEQFYQTLPEYEYSGHIYLYGEAHAVKEILNKEHDLWAASYQAGSRDLFIELPYYTGEYLNIWLKENNDSILNLVYEDWKGSLGYNPLVLEFYKRIKTDCPETIFHGTDVGHQYWSTGTRFLKYLEDKNLTVSDQYSLTKEAIDQGIEYYKDQNAVYRENAMVTNFCRELNKLHNVDVMGFYGNAHTGLNNANYTGQVPSMANQLNYIYGYIIHSQDLTK